MDQRDIKAHAGMAARDYETQANIAGMAAQQQCGEAIRESLYDRISIQANRARIEARKADKLQELLVLMEENPAVTRILDLLDDVRF